jgi:hypothetical protein
MKWVLGECCRWKPTSISLPRVLARSSLRVDRLASNCAYHSKRLTPSGRQELQCNQAAQVTMSESHTTIASTFLVPIRPTTKAYFAGKAGGV